MQSLKTERVHKMFSEWHLIYRTIITHF